MSQFQAYFSDMHSKHGPQNESLSNPCLRSVVAASRTHRGTLLWITSPLAAMPASAASLRRRRASAWRCAATALSLSADEAASAAPLVGDEGLDGARDSHRFRSLPARDFSLVRPLWLPTSSLFWVSRGPP